MKAELLKKDILKKTIRREWAEENGVRMGFHTIRKGDLTIRLARMWGFCYGVLYAIDDVSAALDRNPGRRVYILGDLIHNPHVNAELERRGAVFIDPREDLDRLEPDAIVVVPAFGAPRDVLDRIGRSRLLSVNTTCPEVKTVEEEVSQFGAEGFTAVIHGKSEHQETIATSSFAERHLVIRDKQEAEAACRFIRGEATRDEFLDRFRHAVSPGFDPGRDLRRIGMANQTTMLMNESLEIFGMFREAVRARDGHEGNFRAIRTICSATQDRQDAIAELAKSEPVTLFLDVGGHRSSNTRNLAITARQNSPGAAVYHIERADDFTPERIRYLPTDGRQAVTQEGWLPPGKVTVGITAGASTPHSELEEVIQKLLSFY
jgi:4-hydroxy-3-methylbut-2-enyl diphosphate reductase